MKHFCKKRFKGLALVLLFSLIIGNVPCAEAATPRLSKKRVSLKVGKTYRLRLRNATGKTIWKSTNKRVAIVNSKGRIKARKKGRAIIIAKNAGRTFKCRVIVRKKSKRSYSYSYVSKKPTANPATTAAVATSAATNAQKNNVDQYRYWNTLSGYGIAQAIASGTWTAQETAVANMNSGLDYFASRIANMKTIDWATVDYILWEYGTNDFSTGVMVSDTTDTTNLFAYDNTYKQTIETILTAYPNIRIITITPLWRWWSSGSPDYTFVDDSNTHTINDYADNPRLLTAFVNKAKEVSLMYQLPCIDDYYEMGANKFTYLHFFNASDGTHPNEEGRQRIAGHIIPNLLRFA